jgi:ribosome-binding factor A
VADKRRILRLQQLILEVAAETMQTEVEDPRLGIVTMTRVKLSSDLSRGTLFWSVLGDERTRRLTEKGMEAVLPLLQRRIAESLATRVTPHLSIRYDASMAKAQRLDEIFHRLEAERPRPVQEPEDPPPGAEPQA